VNIATYARRNLFRRIGRTIMTLIAIALAVFIFCLIRTVDWSFNVGADAAMQDRLATRHKVSITMQLPKHYIDDVRAIPGVTKATWVNWFGAKDPQERVPFLAGFAADADSWFDVYDDMKVDPKELADWKATPNGVIIGDALAKTFKVKVGDKLNISSDIYPGDWDFKIVGIYYPMRKTVDRNSVVLRWDYLNNDPRAALTKDQIGWIMSRISNGRDSAKIATAIDKVFDEKDDQTLSMSERAFSLSFLAGFGALLKAFNVMSVVILLIMTLVLANTIAMSVRERRHEYGVLKAIGFSPTYIGGFILGEGLLIGIVGGLLGLALVQLLINMALGPFLEENMASMFTAFRTPSSIMLLALGLAVILAVIAAVVPAISASKLKVTDALRRVD